VTLPLGLGARHLAAASISNATKCVAVVASASALVRLFDHGALIAEMIPELWLLNHQGLQLLGLPLRGNDEL
jgi:diadenylate cyclase